MSKKNTKLLRDAGWARCRVVNGDRYYGPALYRRMGMWIAKREGGWEVAHDHQFNLTVTGSVLFPNIVTAFAFAEVETWGCP